MSKVYMLAPGFSPTYHGGGLYTIQRLAAAIGGILVSTHEHSPEFPALDDILKSASQEDIFIISWGPHINGLIQKLKGRRTIYWANSLGWGINLPPSVPILAASKFTMGYWAEDAVGSPIYYLPNPLDDEFINYGLDREIDVLVLERKSSKYLLKTLVPELRSVGLNTVVQRDYVPSSADLFNSSKVYLYDSQEYWSTRGQSEGFGLQPLEALACGCAVFTSMNAGLSDYVDPPHFAHKIGNYNVEYDISRIVEAVKGPQPDPIITESYCSSYRFPATAERWAKIETDLNPFWSFITSTSSFVHKQSRSYGAKKL